MVNLDVKFDLYITSFSNCFQEALKLHRLSKRQRQGDLSLLKVKIPDELLTLATYFKVTENDITQR